MKSNEFFKKQTALTSAKTKIYKEYIEGYLPKLLMSFGTCLIADLFCGPGKNGKENGSPLILIDRLNYILSSPLLKSKTNLKVYVLFNDDEKKNIENLNTEIENLEYDKNIITILTRNEKYENILPELVKMPEKMKIPKFFFLDPFTYSTVKMRDIKELISLTYSEILLFIPIFHSYRFSNNDFEENHKTRIFIEEYTTKGIADYQNIDKFMISVREKLLQETQIPYVRPVLLDGGGSKNSLFLLTKHQKGMLLMNKIALKTSEDGNSVKVKNDNQNSLFSVDEISQPYENFKNNLIDFLRNNEKTNSEIVDFAIKNCFLPSHAKKEIKKLYDLSKIFVFDSNNIKITDIRKWNIADNISIITNFKWNNDEKK
jgi:three-Cys-motif partner protein